MYNKIRKVTNTIKNANNLIINSGLISSNIKSEYPLCELLEFTIIPATINIKAIMEFNKMSFLFKRSPKFPRVQVCLSS
jgi:hypothetical protein